MKCTRNPTDLLHLEPQFKQCYETQAPRQVSSPRSAEVWSLKKISCPSRCPLVSQEVLQNHERMMITIKIQWIQSLKPKRRKFTTPKCCFQGHHPSSQGLQARVRGQTESLWGSRVVDVIRSSMDFRKRRTNETLPPTHNQNISKSAKIKHMFSTFSAKMFIQLVLPKASILVWQDLWTHHLSFFPWCGDRHAAHLRQDGRWREKSTSISSISRSAAFHVFEGSVQSFAFGGVHEDLSRISKAHNWTSLDRCFSTFFLQFQPWRSSIIFTPALRHWQKKIKNTKGY